MPTLELFRFLLENVFSQDLRIRYFDESIQEMVLVLANENLNAIINTLGSHCAHIQQHLHRRPGAPAVTSVSYLTIYVYM